MQKDIVDAFRKKEADFLIELKANRKALLYMTSLAADAQYLGYIIRKHWSIENVRLQPKTNLPKLKPNPNFFLKLSPHIPQVCTLYLF